MEDEYKTESDQIEKIGSESPDQVLSNFDQGGVNNFAPNLAPHLASAATSAVSFLKSKLPNKGNGLFEDNSEPSRADKSKFLAYHRAVTDPVSVIDDMKQGRLSSIQLESLKTVYPDLHEEMKGKIISHLADMQAGGKKLDYSQRNVLSMFLGQPLDSTMTPQSAQAIIASAGMQQAQRQAQPGPKKASGTELKQINKVDALYPTSLQARAISRTK